MKLYINQVKVSAVFAALALYLPSINYTFSEHAGYEYTDLITALLLFGFSLISLIFGLRKSKKKFSVNIKFLIISLLSIVMLWLAVFMIEVANGTEMSDYDRKRPFFAILGILIFGLLGIIGSILKEEFIYKYLHAVTWLSLILAIMYIGLFDIESQSARIGGDSGLIIGVLIAQGIGATFALYYMGKIKFSFVVFAILIMVLAVFMSGTRSAIISVLLNGLFLFYLSSGRSKIEISLIIGIAIVLIYFSATNFIPNATLLRVTNFQLEGSENRLALLLLGLDSLMENPFGKINNYIGVFPSEIQYAHNAFLQFVLELGVMSLPFIVIHLIGIINYLKISANMSGVYIKGLIFYVLPILVMSLSAGDAYNPQFWFAILLISSIGYSVSSRTKFNKD